MKYTKNAKYIRKYKTNRRFLSLILSQLISPLNIFDPQ